MTPSTMYAFARSERIGCFFVIIENDFRNAVVNCLTLPDMGNDYLEVDEFSMLLDQGIIEKVDVLPKNVFDVCKKQYYNNREILEKLLTRNPYEPTDRREQRNVESSPRSQTIYPETDAG